jgi:hypothetical protein
VSEKSWLDPLFAHTDVERIRRWQGLQSKILELPRGVLNRQDAATASPRSDDDRELKVMIYDLSAVRPHEYLSSPERTLIT